MAMTRDHGTMELFTITPSETRTSFMEAAEYLIDTASLIAADQWEAPGLGHWSIRELVGHAGRALLNVSAYLATPAESADLAGPVAYFMAAFGSGSDSAATSQAILERGREAGLALGAEPLGALHAWRNDALAALANAEIDTIVTTPFGSIALSDYLATRTFELVIHTLDLHRALGTSPIAPQGPLLVAALIATSLAVKRGFGAETCLSLTGRTPPDSMPPFL